MYVHRSQATRVAFLFQCLFSVFVVFASWRFSFSPRPLWSRIRFGVCAVGVFVPVVLVLAAPPPALVRGGHDAQDLGCGDDDQQGSLPGAHLPRLVPRH
jgi:hypothetical protein